MTSAVAATQSTKAATAGGIRARAVLARVSSSINSLIS